MRVFLDGLRAKGAEISLHGLNQDGTLFRDRQNFLKQALGINVYAKEYNAAGFRSSHPDYIKVPPYNNVYESLLGYPQRVCDEQNIWIALPGEVNKW